MQRHLETRSSQLQETKDLIAAFRIARKDAMALMKATHAKIHETFGLAQNDAMVASLRELVASRAEQAANIASFNTAIQEQQQILERLTELTALYDEFGVMAQCEQCHADILPLELDQCLPVSNVLSLLLCPSCSTQTGHVTTWDIAV